MADPRTSKKKKKLEQIPYNNKSPFFPLGVFLSRTPTNIKKYVLKTFKGYARISYDNCHPGASPFFPC